VEFKIVRGKFITVDKLDALVSANGLGLSALLDGAGRKIEEINVKGKELSAQAAEYLTKSLDCQNQAELLLEQRDSIQEAIKSIKETE